MLDRDTVIPFPCPKCQHEIKETIARLETNPTLTCAACNTSFGVDAEELRRGLQEVDQSLAKLASEVITIDIKL
jgi:hypothetical protein